MASTVLHELAEMATDPYLNAWKTPSGQENADVCYREFKQHTAWANGAKYNLVGSGGSRFLIQAMLHPLTQQCVLQA